MAKEQIALRVAEDVKDALDEFAEEEGLSQADALRRCVTDSLEARGYYENEVDRGILKNIL